MSLEGTATSIKKVGFKVPISWEALFGSERKGHYEPVGVKWIQWVTWVIGFIVFKAWAGLEKALDKSRHFQGVSGYEWDEAEYRPFKQKTRWVSDE